MSFYDKIRVQNNCDFRLELLRCSKNSRRMSLSLYKKEPVSELDTSSELDSSYDRDSQSDIVGIGRQKGKDNDEKGLFSSTDKLKLFAKQQGEHPALTLSQNKDHPNLNMTSKFSNSSGCSSEIYDIVNSTCGCKNLAKERPSKEKTFFICEICLVECNSKLSVLQHVKGARHTRKKIVLKEYVERNEYQYKRTTRNDQEDILEIIERLSTLEQENALLRYEMESLKLFITHNIPIQKEISSDDLPIKNPKHHNRVPPRFVAPEKMI